jgi:hypothetical protein
MENNKNVYNNSEKTQTTQISEAHFAKEANKTVLSHPFTDIEASEVSDAFLKKQKPNSVKNSKSFFADFSEDEIFTHWNTSNSILEIAQKLGLKNAIDLKREDYEYIKNLKNRKTWRERVVSIDRRKERQRPAFVRQISKKELEFAMNLNAIETLSHLALHFLLSPKHGRLVVKERLLELKIIVKSALHKGVYGVSETPQHWPTQYYEKRVTKKPMICSVCGFNAKVPQQIELHHSTDIDGGPKKKKRFILSNARHHTYVC